MPKNMIRKTREKIRRSLGFQKRTKKASETQETALMMEETEELYPTSTVEQALKKFLETNSEELPVIEAGKKTLLGSITPLDIFDYYGGGRKNNIFLKNKENMKSAANTHIKSIMNEKPAVSLKKDKMEKIIENLRTSNTVFVVDNGKLEGKVSDTTLLEIIKGSVIEKKVSQMMTKKAITATPGYTVKDACEIMVRNKLGEIPVISEGRIAGIITKTDLMKYFSTKALEKTHESALSQRIEYLMTKKVRTLKPGDNAEKAISVMLKTGYRAIPVKNKKEIGIISQKDIVKVIK